MPTLYRYKFFFDEVYGPLAQLVEQQTLNLRVEGSIPSRLKLSKAFLKIPFSGKSLNMRRRMFYIDVVVQTLLVS